jgi:hypothetical protein
MMEGLGIRGFYAGTGCRAPRGSWLHYRHQVVACGLSDGADEQRFDMSLRYEEIARHDHEDGYSKNK